MEIFYLQVTVQQISTMVPSWVLHKFVFFQLLSVYISENSVVTNLSSIENLISTHFNSVNNNICKVQNILASSSASISKEPFGYI